LSVQLFLNYQGGRILTKMTYTQGGRILTKMTYTQGGRILTKMTYTGVRYSPGLDTCIKLYYSHSYHFCY